MAIDYMIDLACAPKQFMGAWSIVERLKARDRARAVIQLFRQHGDQRPPSEMGFEMARRLPDGTEEVQVVIVQDMLNVAEPLDAYAAHCAYCPANAARAPYGCVGFIQYPISSAGEAWLLDQLPSTQEPLMWLLVLQGVQELHYTGDSVRSLRSDPTYFEEARLRGRDLGEGLILNANQVFEMLFLLGDIQPAHAGVLLLLFGAVRRDIEAPEIQRILNSQLSREEIEQGYPFLLHPSDEDEATTADCKRFFRALHTAWKLGLPLRLDV